MFVSCMPISFRFKQFANYNSKTSGPFSFQGPLGKELQGDLIMRKLVGFTKIRNDSFPRLPDEVVAERNHDQEYLYDICWGMSDSQKKKQKERMHDR